MYFFPDLEPVCCSMSISNCCFLTCIQISQKAGKVVQYSHLFKNFPQFVVIYTVKLLRYVQLFVTPLATQIMELSRPEYWSILPFCSRGNLPSTGIEPRSPTLQEDSLRAQPPGKPIVGWVTHVDKRLLLECCAVLCLVAHPVNFLQPHGLYPASLLCLWGFSRQEYWRGCHALLQGFFPTQGLDPGLLYSRQILYQVSHLGRWINVVCSYRAVVIWGPFH